MSQPAWHWPLLEEEELLWQGRPTPRCYTFRQWKLICIATLLFLACSFWQMLAYQLVLLDNYPYWLLLIPLPFTVAALYFGPLKLLLARWGWEKLFYALTTERLLIRQGFFSASQLEYPLAGLQLWQQKQFSGHLASIRLIFNKRRPVVLECLEHPQLLIEHLAKQHQNSAGDSV